MKKLIYSAALVFTSTYCYAIGGLTGPTISANGDAGGNGGNAAVATNAVTYGPSTNVVFLDNVLGSDTTTNPRRASVPFLTLSNAVHYLNSMKGGTIVETPFQAFSNTIAILQITNICIKAYGATNNIIGANGFLNVVGHSEIDGGTWNAPLGGGASEIFQPNITDNNPKNDILIKDVDAYYYGPDTGSLLGAEAGAGNPPDSYFKITLENCRFTSSAQTINSEGDTVTFNAYNSIFNCVSTNHVYAANFSTIGGNYNFFGCTFNNSGATNQVGFLTFVGGAYTNANTFLHGCSVNYSLPAGGTYTLWLHDTTGSTFGYDALTINGVLQYQTQPTITVSATNYSVVQMAGFLPEGINGNYLFFSTNTGSSEVIFSNMANTNLLTWSDPATGAGYWLAEPVNGAAVGGGTWVYSTAVEPITFPILDTLDVAALKPWWPLTSGDVNYSTTNQTVIAGTIFTGNGFGLTNLPTNFNVPTSAPPALISSFVGGIVITNQGHVYHVPIY